MDVLYKIKSVVTNVLPVGNPITNDFEIHSHKASGGPGMLWKIYDGVDKSTKQEASIFILEKKLLDRFQKKDKESLLESFKRGVSQLTKLRHPKILSVIHPLEDSRESLAFATEPLFASLGNLLGQHDNLPNPTPASFKNFKFFDVEIRYGLLQIAESLSFLHESVKMVHGNFCPESIFINKYGCWKLSGFEHCIGNANAQGEPYFPYKEFDQNSDPITQAKLNFLAPEYGLSGSCDTSSDMFSFGMLVYSIYNNGKYLNECLGDWKTYKVNCTELRKLNVNKLTEIPEVFKDHVKLLLNFEPTLRPNAIQITRISYFEDVGVMTLTYLDLLVQKDNLQKSQFFKDLGPIVGKLPKRVNLQRVLPTIAKECHNNIMVPFILPSIIEVAKMASEEEYAISVLPVLIPIFKITEPIQVMLILLQHMDLLLSKTSQNDIRNHILPMISKCLEINIPKMQDLCLNIMPTFASLVEHSSLKNSIVPRICKLCTSTNVSLSIQVNCLVCLGKLLEYLDKWFVLDEILPILQTIQSKEPAILMSILGIYKITLSHSKLGITKELLSQKILPSLFPLCTENTLNLNQFNTFIGVIKDMVGRVESEHRQKLEQLDSLQQEQKTLQKFSQEAFQINSNGDNAQITNNDLDFLSNNKTVESLNPFDDVVSNQEKEQKKYEKKKQNISLTMEEKEKLAKNQELQDRFKSSEVPLKPFSNSDINKNANKNSLYSLSQQPSKSQPKDLTSTLMDNNLSMLASKGFSKQINTNSNPNLGLISSVSLSNSINANIYGNLSNSGFSFQNNSNFNLNTSILGKSSVFNNQGFQNTYGINQNHNSFDMTSYGNTQIFSGSNNLNSSGFSSSFQQPKQVDMSAFDSIQTGIQSKQFTNNKKSTIGQPLSSMNISNNIDQNNLFKMPVMENRSINNTNILNGTNVNIMNNNGLFNTTNTNGNIYGGSLTQMPTTNKALSSQEIKDLLG